MSIESRAPVPAQPLCLGAQGRLRTRMAEGELKPRGVAGSNPVIHPTLSASQPPLRPRLWSRRAGADFLTPSRGSALPSRSWSGRYRAPSSSNTSSMRFPNNRPILNASGRLGIVLLGLDRVDGLPRHAELIGEVTLRPFACGPQRAESVLHHAPVTASASAPARGCRRPFPRGVAEGPRAQGSQDDDGLRPRDGRPREARGGPCLRRVEPRAGCCGRGDRGPWLMAGALPVPSPCAQRL